MRALIALLALTPPPALAAGLNDTGMSQCLNAAGTAYEACSSANSGDAGAWPRQDGRFGRDAAATAGTLTKVGGGAAGFDFTALDASGTPVAPGGHACVRDNVTNLIWSTETLGPMNWSTAGTTATTYSRCGFSIGWRPPTRRELLSIVHHGTSTPSIDTIYFPGTVSWYYWSSDVFQPDPALAWDVNFYDGYASALNQSDTLHVRLVRSGQ